MYEINFSHYMFRQHKHFGGKFCCSNYLCENFTEVYAETQSFVNKFNMHKSSSFMSSLHATVT